MNTIEDPVSSKNMVSLIWDMLNIPTEFLGVVGLTKVIGPVGQKCGLSSLFWFIKL